MHSMGVFQHKIPEKGSRWNQVIAYNLDQKYVSELLDLVFRVPSDPLIPGSLYMTKDT